MNSTKKPSKKPSIVKFTDDYRSYVTEYDLYTSENFQRILKLAIERRKEKEALARQNVNKESNNKD